VAAFRPEMRKTPALAQHIGKRRAVHSKGSELIRWKRTRKWMGLSDIAVGS
jgi:hypothetical protein